MNYMVKTLGMFRIGSGRSDAESGQGSRKGSIERRRTMTVVNLGDVDSWRAISNQDERVRGTTCSPRCHRRRQRKHCLRTLQGVREKRREHGQDLVKLMFIDVKIAHLETKCEEEEWVELPDEFKTFGWYAKLTVIWDEKGSVWMGGRVRNETGEYSTP